MSRLEVGHSCGFDSKNLPEVLTATVASVAFSNAFAASGDLLDVVQMERVQRIDLGNFNATSAVYDDWRVTLSDAHEIVQVDLRRHLESRAIQPRYSYHRGPVQALTTSPDGTMYASVDCFGQAALWDAADGALRQCCRGADWTGDWFGKRLLFGRRFEGELLAGAPSGSHFVTSGEVVPDTFRAWRLPKPADEVPATDHSGWIGRGPLAAGHRGPAFDWEIVTDADGRRAAVRFEDRIWWCDLDGPNAFSLSTLSLKWPPCGGIAWVDHETLAAGHLDGTVDLLPLAGGRSTLSATVDPTPVSNIAFRGGQLAVTSQTGDLALREVESGRTLWTRRISPVRRIQFVPDRPWLLAWHHSSDVRLLKVEDGEELHHFGESHLRWDCTSSDGAAVALLLERGVLEQRGSKRFALVGLDFPPTLVTHNTKAD